ncbi:MAG: hypothetical protein ACRCYX_03460 [Dermatophilaceae bacterium]
MSLDELLGSDGGLTALLGAAVFGFGSALLPILNVEAFAAVVAGARMPWFALVVAVTTGTTVGKCVVFVAARRGSATLDRWQARWHPQREPASLPAWRQRIRRWSQAMLIYLDRPWTAAPVVLVSATIGLPPLAVVSALAGVRRTPLLLFAVTVFLGRLARLTVIATPIAAAT